MNLLSKMTMLRNCMDRMSPAGKTVVPFLNRSHNNSLQVLVGHCVLCVLCSHRISGCYVSDHKAWADKINRRFQSCRTDYNKIEKRGKFGKSGQAKYKSLTALQKWKYEWYSFLAPFYKQGQKPLAQSKSSAVLGGLPPSTDNESDEGPDDGNDSSSSNTQKEGGELFHSSLTSPPPIRKSMKRTRSKDDKVSPDEKSCNYGELVTVMKESASHLVRGSADRRDPERDSFFTWLNDFTSKLPRHSWRTFQMKTVALAMEITPAESPQPNTARSRIEPEQQQQQQQQQQQPHSIYPPPWAIGPSGTTFIDLTQAQPSQQYQGGPSIPNQMVSAVLSHSCRAQVTTCLGATLARSCCMLVL